MFQTRGILCWFVPMLQLGKTEKSDVALVAMTKQIVHWNVTFAEFDPDESNFDLRGMAVTKITCFVLNSRANAIYHVSKNGSCLSKVNIVDTPPKYHLSSPANICSMLVPNLCTSRMSKILSASLVTECTSCKCSCF